MDYIEATTKLVASLAWPTVAAISITMFREEIRDVLKRAKSIKAIGAELQMSEIEKVAAELVIQKEKVDDKSLSGEEREDAIRVYSAGVDELAALAKARNEVPENPEFTKLSPGRESILREVVETMGPEAILNLTPAQLRVLWPQLKEKAHLNGGSMVGLKTVGVVDESYQLTHIGGKLIRALASEMLAQSKPSSA